MYACFMITLLSTVSSIQTVAMYYILWTCQLNIKVTSDFGLQASVFTHQKGMKSSFMTGLYFKIKLYKGPVAEFSGIIL